MKIEYIQAKQQDGNALAELRAIAMKPSLEAAGRFDEARVRNRFLESFDPGDTCKLVDNGEIVGFYVLRDRVDHFYLDHLYIHPEHQSRRLGRAVIERVLKIASERSLSVRLGALKGSPANDFYLKLGFKKIREDEFDIYYELRQ